MFIFGFGISSLCMKSVQNKLMMMNIGGSRGRAPARPAPQRVQILSF